MDIFIVAEKSAKPLSFLNKSLFCKLILFAQIGYIEMLVVIHHCLNKLTIIAVVIIIVVMVEEYI